MLPADCPVVPRSGESMTAAIFRAHDKFAGTGLTATDQTAIIVDDAAQAVQKLRDCAGHNAELMIANRAYVATIRDLQESLASADALIVDLQHQLDEARSNCVTDAAIEVAWALHLEGLR